MKRLLLKRREVLALGLGVLLDRVVTAQDRPEQAKPSPLRYTDERTYDVEHRIDVNPSGNRLDSFEIWLPLPFDDYRQTITRLKVEPRVPVVRDKSGMAQVARVLYPTRPNRGRPILSLRATYRVACRAVTPNLEMLARDRTIDYRKDKTYKLFTRPEKKLNLDDPRIQRVAQKCRGKGRTPLQIARAAYDWIAEHTRYQLIDGFGGAAYCLENGHGECGDYAALFMALCRSAGVPARPASGYWADKTDGWHCWAEMMLPSGHWLPMDPQMGDSNRWSRAHYFGGVDNRRVALCKTYDVDLKVSGGRHTADFLQTGAWWWTGQKPASDDTRPRATFHIQGTPVTV
ncbi:MAG: transglutaminase domain-containing protein [Pirellulales bacterium]|nr:transglutaminase domain-containing protein [Pirellulales bacterium]